jgi:hypothetical protein
MTTQLTLQGLLDALGSVEQNATLMVTGFGSGAYPGTLFRHRPFVDGLAIEPSLNRAHSTTPALYVERLREFGLGRKLETYRRRPFEDQHPAGPDTPVWVGTPHELSFYAVTGVEMVKGFAVIRTTNFAPEQGPSLQRLSDDEVINRRRVEHLQRMGDDVVFAPHVERLLLNMLPGERSRALHELDEARKELASFETSLQAKKDRVAKLEEDAVRLDYLLGIRDDLPGAEAGCNGVCHRASDMGVFVAGDPVAYPHESCPEHGSGQG